jgi:hypothetical protein
LFNTSYVIYLLFLFLTAIGLVPGGSSTVHICTQTVHKTQRTEHAYKCYLFLTGIGLTPGGSSTVYIYTQTVHRMQQYSTHLHTNSTQNTKNGTYI